MSSADRALVIEASTGHGSVALVRDHTLVAEASVPMRGPDGERLMPTIVDLLASTGESTASLHRIVCGAGPGGFTSLRIAAAIGKGIAESLGVPLWAMSSLALLAAGAVDAQEGERRGDASIQVIAVLDAMRSEWHARHFSVDAAGRPTARGPELLLGRDALTELLERTGARLIGSAGDTFEGGRLAFPRARDVLRLQDGPFWRAVDLLTWEPDYGRLAEAQVKWEHAHGRPLGLPG